ncbi:Fe-S cluster assembly ATPase SufC [Pyrofollis japonicus]|uniref:Fe-S cluster assembly ATPase SufC n=1 Tax=Pyrofollis japonicus TaxID=3060460 RepID=UPI00295A9516|nr:Fe-S cluster assembly ATPase SufC [Pyrofollis japonicus]
MFEVSQVKVYVSDGKEVVKGVSLSFSKPGIYVIMGPNGAGKSSLVNAIMGHQGYVVEGRIVLNGEDITKLPTHEKARKGITLAVQMPIEIEGVRVAEILTRIIKRFRGITKSEEASRLARELLSIVGLPEDFLYRYFMVGMSGGERKRLELVRVIAQKPKVALLDEPDSGVDVESMPLIARAIKKLRDEGAIVILISHQPRLFEYLEPDEVYVMYDGRIVLKGGLEVIKLIEEKGYTWIAQKSGGGKQP